MVQVEVIATPELGDRSYVAHDTVAAIVVDPQRDLDRVERVLHDKGLHCELVAETHVHNDYVTGGYELSRRTGAAYAVSAGDRVDFPRLAADDGDEIAVGSMTVRVVATPGHTDHHLSYVVSDPEGAGVFTGGSLLYGTVGRTDLVDPHRTEELARAQYHSARRLSDLLPGPTPVYPTHGFGSFCSSGSSAASGSSAGSGSPVAGEQTIAAERTRNDALTEPDEDAFVRRLVGGLTAYPAYYAHMGARNRQGPSAADLSPVPEVDATELHRRLGAGQWVVDLRDRVAYAQHHLAGSISIELGEQFATYLGWLMPWGSPLTLIGETAAQVADAQRQLVRIGVDRPAGAATGPLAGEGRSYPRATFADLTSVLGHTGSGEVVLDVRRDDERERGAIAGSVHIPLHSLLTRLAELPDGRLWVHCASGYRSAIAASLLERAGRDVVYVDDEIDAATLGVQTG